MNSKLFLICNLKVIFPSFKWYFVPTKTRPACDSLGVFLHPWENISLEFWHFDNVELLIKIFLRTFYFQKLLGMKSEKIKKVFNRTICISVVTAIVISHTVVARVTCCGHVPTVTSTCVSICDQRCLNMWPEVYYYVTWGVLLCDPRCHIMWSGVCY